MTYIEVSDVRAKLGEAYSTEPSDDIISFFIQRREAEVKERTGEEWTDAASCPALIKTFILNSVCADILLRDLTGDDNVDALNTSLGELKIDKSENIKFKLQFMETLAESANLALQTYLAQKQYYDYDNESSLIYKRSEP